MSHEIEATAPSMIGAGHEGRGYSNPNFHSIARDPLYPHSVDPVQSWWYRHYIGEKSCSKVYTQGPGHKELF